jgi:hypothetical protein
VAKRKSLWGTPLKTKSERFGVRRFLFRAEFREAKDTKDSPNEGDENPVGPKAGIRRKISTSSP